MLINLYHQTNSFFTTSDISLSNAVTFVGLLYIRYNIYCKIVKTYWF